VLASRLGLKQPDRRVVKSQYRSRYPQPRPQIADIELKFVENRTAD